jgi:GAF domain-containing protein
MIPCADFFLEEGIQSAIYVPLVSKGEPVGAMVISSRSTFDLSDDYLEFLVGHRQPDRGGH